MKSIGMKQVWGALLVAGVMGGGSVSAGPSTGAPKTVTETRYFKDVSAYFYNVLPFLKKGFQFLDSSSSAGMKEGSVSSLLVHRPGIKDSNSLADAKPVKVTKDFAPYVDAIKTPKEALTYVMFFSRKGYPWLEPIQFDYFQDIPFTSVEFVHASSATLASHSVRSPRVTEEKGWFFGKKRFTIVRTVVPLDQPSLKEEILLKGKSPLELTELGEVTETVTEEGTYSFTLRRIPVQKFPIENPLKFLRKK